MHRISSAFLRTLAVLACAVPALGDDRAESPYFDVRGAGAAATGTFPLTDTNVDVTIAGMIADVAITQTYANRGSTTLDAVYMFPGSTRAAVHGLTMMIGDRVVEAQIQTKPQARRTFEQAKAEGRTATLLEEHRPNVFQMTLGHIRPGDVVQVVLRYTELLEPTDGQYEFVFPQIVGPRYSEDPHADALQQAMQAGSSQGVAPPTFGLQVELAGGVPIAAITSPTHVIDVRSSREDRASILLAEDAPAARDFILHYRLAGDVVHTGLLLSGQGTADDPGYFLAMVQPPARPDHAVTPPRDYVFIVDVSGSMSGFPLDTAKSLMTDLISELRPEDTFNVVTFAGGASQWSPTPLPATPENLAAVIVMLERQSGGGGTDLLGALRTAEALPRREPLSRTLVVVTDGYVTVEAEAFDFVRRHLDHANVFAFGIGGSVNRHLIECLARAGMGETFIVTKPQEAPEVAARFHRYIAHPVLTTVAARTEGFRTTSLTSEALPDLFAQRPVILAGRWTGSRGGQIHISGANADGTFEQTLAVADAVDLGDSRALELLWARKQIGMLADKEACDPQPEFAESITRLGLAHGLLTKYTSFVAVDRVARPDPAPQPPGVDDNRTVLAARNPTAGGNVPATPEPATWGMIVLTVLALAWLAWQRRPGARADSTGPA